MIKLRENVENAFAVMKEIELGVQLESIENTENSNIWKNVRNANKTTQANQQLLNFSSVLEEISQGTSLKKIDEEEIKNYNEQREKRLPRFE